MSFIQEISFIVLAVLVGLSNPASADADVVSFMLDNVHFDTGLQMTGEFNWTYDAGDFEDGSGEFTSLDIPYTDHDHNDLIITIETSQLEFSLDGNVHDDGLDIKLSLLEPFNATNPVFLNLDPAASKYSIGGNGFHDGHFVSGKVSPISVPEPTPVVAFLFLAMLTTCRTKCRQCSPVSTQG